MKLMHKLGHAGVIHVAMESTWQGGFNSWGQFRLWLLTKSQIYSIFSVKVSFQLHNFILHLV